MNACGGKHRVPLVARLRAITFYTQRFLGRVRQRRTVYGNALCKRLLKDVKRQTDTVLSHRRPRTDACAMAPTSRRLLVVPGVFTSSGRDLYDHTLFCGAAYCDTPYPVTLRAEPCYIVQVPFGTKMAAMSSRSGRSRAPSPRAAASRVFKKEKRERKRGVVARVTLWRCCDVLSSFKCAALFAAVSYFCKRPPIFCQL